MAVLRRLFLLLAFAAMTSQPTFGQAPPKGADPKDVESVDSIMNAIYDVISGPAGQKRDWDRMRSLFAANAKMGAVVRDRSGQTRYVDFDVERYVKMYDRILTEKGFFEHERRRRVDTFGNIAQVFSSYESRWKADDKTPFERGVNELQLVNDGRRWWIVSILWQGENDKLKLPGRW
jgi:hypothetical protein